MATKIKKGTEVWMFRNWNGMAKVAVRKLIITSMGKTQGTAEYSVDGKNLKCRIYAAELENLVAVADCVNPTEEGLKRAEKQKAKQIQFYVDRAHFYSDDAKTGEGYHASMKFDCEECIADNPEVIFL